MDLSSKSACSTDPVPGQPTYTGKPCLENPKKRDGSEYHEPLDM